MADKNWAEQAEAVLKRRRSVMREFAALSPAARKIAEQGFEMQVKAELRAIVGPYPMTNSGYTIFPQSTGVVKV